MGARHAMEALEQLRQFVGRDAGAGVAHGEDEMLVRLTQPHLDFAVESELEGVGEEIEDDLLPHLAIDAGRLGKRRAIDNEPQARLLDRRAKHAGEFCRRGGEVGRFVDGLHAPCLDAREIEERVDQFQEPQTVSVGKVDLVMLARGH